MAVRAQILQRPIPVLQSWDFGAAGVFSIGGSSISSCRARIDTTPLVKQARSESYPPSRFARRRFAGFFAREIPTGNIRGGKNAA